MGDNTGIEWTDATWNPTVGCSILSPGCARCYAMKQAARIERMGGAGGARYAGLTQPSKAGPVWTGEVRLNEAALDLPLRWRRPRRIFVNSMSDLFHESLPDDAIDKVFRVMAMTRHHIFQVLTKRAERMRAYITTPHRELDIRYKPIAWPLPNVWLGVSVEDQPRADERVPALLATPAAVRFLSCEPLLGPVDLHRVRIPHGVVEANGGMLPPLEWVIVGGESGPGARESHVEHHRFIKDQCRRDGVAFFEKQLGSRPMLNGAPWPIRDRKGGDINEFPEDLRVREFPRRA